jgi:transcriptional regulator with XRE-family HTH domain
LAKKKPHADEGSPSANRQTSWIDGHVGRRLFSYRKLRKMSRRQLALACQITERQLVKYEQGINRLSVARLYQLSVILGVPVTQFFSEDSGAATRPADLERLIMCFASIADESQRATLVALAEQLADPGPLQTK